MYDRWLLTMEIVQTHQYLPCPSLHSLHVHFLVFLTIPIYSNNITNPNNKEIKFKIRSLKKEKGKSTVLSQTPRSEQLGDDINSLVGIVDP